MIIVNTRESKIVIKIGAMEIVIKSVFPPASIILIKSLAGDNFAALITNTIKTLARIPVADEIMVSIFKESNTFLNEEIESS